MKLANLLLHQFMRHKLLFGLFLFGILVEVGYAAAAPLSLKYLVDEAFTPKHFTAFIIILCVLFGLGLLNLCASALGDYSLARLSGQVTRKLRADLYFHLQKQSLPFYQRYPTGDLVTRFSADMSSIERVLRFSSPLILKETLGIGLGLAMLFILEWKLTLVMLAGSTLMFVGPKLLQRRTETANVNYKEAQERFSNTIDETVKGHQTIKSLRQQERFRERATRQIHEMFTFGLKLHMMNALMERIPLTVLLVLNGALIGYGGYLIFHDQMTIGEFIAFFTLFMTVGQSATNAAALIPYLIESKVSFDRVGEMLEYSADVPEPAEPVELDAFRSLSMDRVTFGYSDQRIQLKDVSLHIEAGSYTAFVGASGSGKSTALQLLSRFYDPGSGAVLMNGVDLRHVSEASLRKLSAIVAQETFLFNATVRDNLLPDLAGATEEEMTEAARQANIDHIIARWPEGYDTPIHHQGASLSGGERQRLALARVWLRKPQLLLLDEATSALDPAAEAAVNEAIQRMRGRMTIVSVTHRLSSVVNADTIHVFHEGAVVESGRHEELLQAGGVYRRLWEKQHGFTLSDDGQHATVEVGWLARLPFFAGIGLPVLDRIAGLFATRICSEGEAVVREGEEGNAFYIIVRGLFEVLKLVPGEADARRVAVLQDGDHFGEIALLRGIPRTATVRALGPGVLLSVRREAFHRLTKEHPQILHALEQTLEKRM